MLIRKLLLGLGLLSLVSVVGAAEKVVTVATLEDYSPYCFPIENSERKTTETIPPGADSSRL